MHRGHVGQRVARPAAAARTDQDPVATQPCRRGEAVLIGEVVADPHGFVEMETVLGGKRLVDWLSGEPLPRIC